jgi:hypothetical protein
MILVEYRLESVGKLTLHALSNLPLVLGRVTTVLVVRAEKKGKFRYSPY